MGTPVYRTIAGIGPFIALIVSVVALFVDLNQLFRFIFPGLPVQADSLMPVLPVFLFIFVGLAPASLATWSLEGKNCRTLLSHPAAKKAAFRGKILFSFLIQIPFMIIGCILFAAAIHVPMKIVWMYFLCGVVLCLYSTFYGMLCDLTHLKTDWNRESEVFKRKSVVLLYIVLNLAITLVVVAVSFYVGFYNGVLIPLRVVTAAYAGAAVLFYILVKRAVSRLPE